MLQLDFISKAWIAGCLVALVAGPLGSIMVWRRMANFGDALSHATLLGVCFAFLLNINLSVGLISISILVAGLLNLFSYQKQVANDTLLSVLAASTLSIGLIMATQLSDVRMDLLSYLYGDILAVTPSDLIAIVIVDILGLAAIIYLWRPLLSITLDEEIARVEGVPVTRVKWSLTIVLAAVFAIAMKLVGVLLITALLIIPAATARRLAKTPEQMAIFASMIGMICVFGGIQLSSQLDWPAGPAIVVLAFSLFLVSLLMSWLRAR
jgi:zinc transport system permease protein